MSRLRGVGLGFTQAVPVLTQRQVGVGGTVPINVIVPAETVASAAGLVMARAPALAGVAEGRRS